MWCRIWVVVAAAAVRGLYKNILAFKAVFVGFNIQSEEQWAEWKVVRKRETVVAAPAETKEAERRG